MYSFREEARYRRGTTPEDKVAESLYESHAFKIHVKGVVTTLELVITKMLGNDMQTLALDLQALGSRHASYGVKPPHYRLVETALLRTLQGALKDQWTETLRKGWAAVFRFISKAMMSGSDSRVEIHKTADPQPKERTMRLQLSSQDSYWYDDRGQAGSDSPNRHRRIIRTKSKDRCPRPPSRSRRRHTSGANDIKRHMTHFPRDVLPDTLSFERESDDDQDEPCTFQITEIIFENAPAENSFFPTYHTSTDWVDDDSSLSSVGSLSVSEPSPVPVIHRRCATDSINTLRMDEAPSLPTRREEYTDYSLSDSSDSFFSAHSSPPRNSVRSGMVEPNPPDVPPTMPLRSNHSEHAMMIESDHTTTEEDSDSFGGCATYRSHSPMGAMQVLVTP